MWASWNTVRMAWSIPWKETPATPAARKSTLWEAAVSMDMDYLLIKKGEKSVGKLFSLYIAHLRTNVIINIRKFLIIPYASV